MPPCALEHLATRRVLAAGPAAAQAVTIQELPIEPGAPAGRLGGRNLPAGSYRASAVATDAAGNASRASRVRFTVRRR